MLGIISPVRHAVTPTMRQHSMGMRLATMKMADSHEWINKVCHSHKIKRCLVIKRKCGYMPQSGWTSEHDAEQHKWVTEDYTQRIYSHEIHHQSIHKESRSVGAWGGGRRQWWGDRLSSWCWIYKFLITSKNSDLHNLNGWTNMPYVIALAVDTNLEKPWRVNLNWVIAFIRPACE